MTPGYADWLLGKARSKARVEHAEGAHLLERSVPAHVEDADSLRLEAARLYMRAGQETESLRILEALVKAKSPRSSEAQALAARARTSMGDYAAALHIYDSLLGKNTPKGKDDLLFEQAIAAILGGQPSRAIAPLDALAQSERRETLRARAAELAAVAVLESKRKDDAILRFRAVITQYPFSLAAWLASVRLKQLGVTPIDEPVPKQAPAAPREVSLEIPRNVAMLHDIGIDDWAAKALSDAEPALRIRYGSAAGELVCDAYEILGVADRRYAWSRDAVGNLDLKKTPDADSRWRWDCRFPRPYSGIIHDLETRWQLPNGLLYAVMRQESSFREKVQSPAGAVGLTQLMPNTARSVNHEFGADLPCAQSEPIELEEPRCNLELGARYLRKLLLAFDGQLPLVVLAYNAGPMIVSHWASEQRPVLLDLFLAKVPFAETRNYVHSVLTNYLVYSWLEQPREPVPALQWTPTPSTVDPVQLY
jgi:soluble lytic murein transglycosylase